jgi:hypothetical protein
MTGQDGMDFLAKYEAADITLTNCDPYVRQWTARQRAGEQHTPVLDHRKTRNKSHIHKGVTL